MHDQYCCSETEMQWIVIFGLKDGYMGRLSNSQRKSEDRIMEDMLKGWNVKIREGGLSWISMLPYLRIENKGALTPVFKIYYWPWVNWTQPSEIFVTLSNVTPVSKGEKLPNKTFTLE